MVLAWHRTPGRRARTARPRTIRYGTIRYGAIRYGVGVAAALTLAASALAATGAAGTAAAAAASCPWVHSRAPVAQRVRQLMAAMTLDDKLAMVDGVASRPGRPVTSATSRPTRGCASRA